MDGAPKGLEVVGGSRVIDRVADVLRGSCSSIVLAANDERASSWMPGIPIVKDVHAGSGGLAGVEAAMESFGDVVVIAWDMPFVPAALVVELLRRADTYDADVVIPESDSPYGFEPFCAYYRGRVHGALREFLTGGGGAARDFLATVDSLHRIPLRDVSRFGEPATLFFNVNSPDDLARARTIADSAR